MKGFHCATAIVALAFALIIGAPGTVSAADLFWTGDKQFLDNSGDPLAAGTISTFDSGTTSNRTTYKEAAESNANTNPVVLDSNGRLPASVYIVSGDWKYVLKDSGGTTLHTEDVIPGAVTTVTTNFARAKCPTQSSAAAAITVETSDAGDCYLLDASGNTITVTLPSAVTIGDGQQVTFTKTDNANSDITINTVSSQTINGSGTSRTLDAQSETLTLLSDGANWHILTDIGATPKTFQLPIGAVILWSDDDACPAGFLELDGGTANLTASHPELFNLWSDNNTQTAIYGETDANSFDMADSRGRFVRHIPDGAGNQDPDAASRTDRGDTTGGDVVGTLQAWATEEHGHTGQAGDNFSMASVGSSTNAGEQTNNRTGTAATAGINTTTPTPTVAAVNITSESRPTNIGFRFCVFADSTP